MRPIKFYWQNCHFLLRHGWWKSKRRENLSQSRLFMGQCQGMKWKKFVRVLRPGLAKGLAKLRREKIKHLSLNSRKKKTFKKCFVERKEAQGGIPLRVQQRNQYMSVMEVFEYVGRKFAIRDKVNLTQRFQGTGNQRRERETRRQNPSPTRTREPQRQRWTHGYRNLKRRIMAGEKTGRAQDARPAAPSAPPRPHAETPNHRRAPQRRPLQEEIRRPLRRASAVQLHKVRLRQGTSEGAADQSKGHIPKARSPRTHPSLRQ
jgi:hypothetical protein